MWHFQRTPFMTESVCNNICLSYEKQSNIRKKVCYKSQSVENTYYFLRNLIFLLNYSGYIYRKTSCTHRISLCTLFTKLDAYSTQTEKY